MVWVGGGRGEFPGKQIPQMQVLAGVEPATRMFAMQRSKHCTIGTAVMEFKIWL